MNSIRIPSSIKHLTRLSCLVTGMTLLAVPAKADVRNWNGSGNVTWTNPANWDTAPANSTITDIARFNNATYGGIVSAPFFPSAGTTSIAGIEIGSGNGAMTLTTANLSIGASGITMEAGAAAATIGRVTSAVAQTWTNNSANTLSFNGANTYTDQVTMAGSGIFNLGQTTATGAGNIIIDGPTVLYRGGVFATGVVSFNSGYAVVVANGNSTNTISITGDVKFGSTSSASPGLSGLKSTTGDRILTFQNYVTSTVTSNFNFNVNPLVLGGNLEISNLAGGDTGLRGINANFTGGLDLNGSDRTLTLSQTVTAGSTNVGLLTLSGNLLINGSGVQNSSLNGGFNTAGVARTITFNNAGTGIPTLSGLLTGAASTVTIAGSSTNARVGALTGTTAHALEVNSTTGGSFLFNGASNFTGGVTVTSGTAVLGVAGVAGTSGGFGTGALVINGGEVRTTVANALLGSSSVSLNGGTLRGFGNATAVNYGGGLISVSGNSSIINERSGAPSATNINMTFGTSVSVGNGQLNVTSTDNQIGGNSTVTFGNGLLTGNGILNVTDNPSFTNRTILSLSTLTATGSGNSIANSVSRVVVSGVTTAGGSSAGSLAVDGLLTATGGVSVAANGTLGGSGTITGNITTLGTGSTFAPKNAPGQLTITGGLNASAGASFVFDLNGTASDLIAIEFGLTGSDTGGMLFNFSGIGAGPTAGFAYTLLTYGSSTGFERADIAITGAPAGYMLDTNFGDSGFLINSNDLQVQFSVIPEPGYAVLILASLGLLVWTVRRKQARV